MPRRATPCPILPRPTMPSVLPLSSPGTNRFHCLFCCRWKQADAPLASISIMVSTNSEMVSRWMPLELVTMTPLSSMPVPASRSAPALTRCSHRSEGARRTRSRGGICASTTSALLRHSSSAWRFSGGSPPDGASLSSADTRSHTSVSFRSGLTAAICCWNCGSSLLAIRTLTVRLRGGSPEEGFIWR